MRKTALLALVLWSCYGTIQTLDEATHLKAKSPCQGYLSVQAGGELGNQIGEYMVVFGLGLMFRLRKVVVEDDHKGLLLQLFPNISLPSLSEIDCEIRNFTEVTPLGLVDSLPDDIFEWAEADNVVIVKYQTVPRPFHPFRKFVQREFQFHKHISDKVQSALHSIGAEHFQKLERFRKPPVFIGVHVRRTNFFTGSNVKMTHQLGAMYFRKAMDIYRQRYGLETVFIMASDDIPWIQEQFGHEPDVYFTHERFPEHIPNHHFDFAMLASANNSIMSVGTYGFFSSYLAAGDVIFADVYLNGIGYETFHMLFMHVPRWQPLHDPEAFVSKNDYNALSTYAWGP